MKDTIQIEGRTYVSTRTLRAKYGVCDMTLYRWRDRGVLPPSIKFSQRLYFDKAEVELYDAKYRSNITCMSAENVIGA